VRRGVILWNNPESVKDVDGLQGDCIKVVAPWGLNLREKKGTGAERPKYYSVRGEKKKIRAGKYNREGRPSHSRSVRKKNSVGR